MLQSMRSERIGQDLGTEQQLIPYQIFDLQVFSHFVGCHFILLILFFETHKILVLMK